jgi:hypothetical protein
LANALYERPTTAGPLEESARQTRLVPAYADLLQDLEAYLWTEVPEEDQQEEVPERRPAPWRTIAQRLDSLVARRRFWRLAVIGVILLGGALGVLAQVLQIGVAHQSSALIYHRGYTLENAYGKRWLCYGWSSGVYHCTAHWHWSGGQAISDNTAWVPRGASASGQGGSASGGPSPAAQRFSTAGEPCQSTNFWVAHISQWAVPPSCYANIYSPNPANYVFRSGFGWCNWWVEVMHPNQPDILWGSEHRRSGVPTPGAAVFFSGGVQGADWNGHYAQVVAVSPGGYWVLVSEMNFAWRGAGWQRVDYRYIHVGPGVTFIS